MSDSTGTKSAPVKETQRVQSNTSATYRLGDVQPVGDTTGDINRPSSNYRADNLAKARSAKRKKPEPEEVVEEQDDDSEDIPVPPKKRPRINPRATTNRTNDRTDRDPDEGYLATMAKDGATALGRVAVSALIIGILGYIRTATSVGNNNRAQVLATQWTI